MVPYGADSLLVTAVILPFPSIIVVSLRIYVRLEMRRTYVGVNDWVIWLSLTFILEPWKRPSTFPFSNSLLTILRSTIFGIIRRGYVAKTFYGKYPHHSPSKHGILSEPNPLPLPSPHPFPALPPQ